MKSPPVRSSDCSSGFSVPRGRTAETDVRGPVSYLVTVFMVSYFTSAHWWCARKFVDDLRWLRSRSAMNAEIPPDVEGNVLPLLCKVLSTPKFSSQPVVPLARLISNPKQRANQSLPGAVSLANKVPAIGAQVRFVGRTCAYCPRVRKIESQHGNFIFCRPVFANLGTIKSRRAWNSSSFLPEKYTCLAKSLVVVWSLVS